MIIYVDECTDSTIMQTGQTYVELEEVEAAEVCFAKGMDFAKKLLYRRPPNPESPEQQDTMQQILELYIDRILVAWKLKQQVQVLVDLLTDITCFCSSIP